MTEIKFKNIDSLRTKAWNNFPSPVRLMMPWMTVYDNTDVITSVLDGNVFLAARTLSTNKINIFSVIDGKCIFLFTSWPLDRVHYEYSFKVEGTGKRLLKNEIVLHIHVRKTSNIVAVKHFLENHINDIKSKNKHKKPRQRIDKQCVQDIVSIVDEWKYTPFDPENQNFWALQTGTYASDELINDFEFTRTVMHLFKIQSIPNSFQNLSHYLIIPK